MDREAGLLVEDQKIGVFVDDPQGPGRGPDGRRNRALCPRQRDRGTSFRGAFFRGQGGEADLLPGREAEIPALGPAVYQDLSLPQQAVNQGKGKIRQGLP
jgi:hypothetical protein